MLIGDASEITALVSQSLRSTDWTIAHAPDNASGFALAKNFPFDLVLTSPESSGHEDVLLLRQLRRILPRIRMIILARDPTPRDVVASIREHAFSYFSQAYSPQSLAEMLRWAGAKNSWDDGIEVVSASLEWIRIKVRCDLDTADRLTQFMREWIGVLPAPEREAFALAAHEILLNAIEYGGNFDPRNSVDVSFLRTHRMIEARIADPGRGFRLDAVPHAALSNPESEPARHVSYRLEHGMRPGGFGILAAKLSVDELVYNEAGNEATLVKFLHPFNSFPS
ncbi:MAG TPA: ATP-binding protein [Verrucomicrobiae bacterium]|nr:ATP-binding protein [Verrucomicrobiae bacterium]